MAFKPGFRVTPCPPEKVRLLAAAGLSLTAIARALHISPIKFQTRFAASEVLQNAHKLGLEDKEKNPPAPHAKTSIDEDAEFGSLPQLQPLDNVIFSAIAAGLVERPAIEKLFFPLAGRRLQVLPAIERLIQHGKILEAPKIPGAILTRYRPASQHA